MTSKPGKRRKEPVVLQLRETLEQFHEIADGYRRSLEAELAAARAEPKPYEYLVRALERQIEAIRKLEALLDTQVWPEMVTVANGSTSVEHTRTHDFF